MLLRPISPIYSFYGSGSPMGSGFCSGIDVCFCFGYRWRFFSLLFRVVGWVSGSKKAVLFRVVWWDFLFRVRINSKVGFLLPMGRAFRRNHKSVSLDGAEVKRWQRPRGYAAIPFRHNTRGKRRRVCCCGKRQIVCCRGKRQRVSRRGAPSIQLYITGSRVTREA